MTEGSSRNQPLLRSEVLGILRKIRFFNELLKDIAQFNIVIDANVILGDLRWLVKKRKIPGAQTELMECIKAGTIVAYVTRSVLAEVEEHIKTIAKDRKISEDALRAEWKTYRKLLKVRTPRKRLIARYKNGRDPDDAPTIALEKMLKADGILSKDNDLLAMGGLIIDLDFTRQARDYSRKTAISATIKISGGIVVLVSWKSVEAALVLINSIVKWFRCLPPTVQAIILVMALAIATKKSSRDRILATVDRANSALVDHWPAIASALLSIGKTFVENTISPPSPTIRMTKSGPFIARV